MSVVQLRMILLVLIFVPSLGTAAAPDNSSSLPACTGAPVDKSTVEKKIAICTSLIQAGHLQDGDLAAAYSNRGQAYLFAGRPARALMDEDEALHIAPTSPQALFLQGQIFWELGLDVAAVSDINRLLESSPGFFEAYVIRGDALVRIGEYAQAVLDLSRAIRLKPDDSQSLYQRGVAYIESHQLYIARADLNRAIALRSDFGEALYERGRLNLLDGKVDAALADFKLVAGSRDVFPNAVSARNYVEALSILKAQPAAVPPDLPNLKPEALVPSKPVAGTHECSAVYPEVSRRRGESGDVMVSYDVEADGTLSSVALAQSSGIARLDDAALWCASTLFRNTPAIDHGKPVRSPNHRAIIRFTLDKGAPETAQDFYGRGHSYLESGEYAGALDAFNQAITMDPSYGDPYFCRGLVWLQLENYARAHDDFEQAVRLKVQTPHVSDWPLFAIWAEANLHSANSGPPRPTNGHGI